MTLVNLSSGITSWTILWSVKHVFSAQKNVSSIIMNARMGLILLNHFDIALTEWDQKTTNIVFYKLNVTTMKPKSSNESSLLLFVYLNGTVGNISTFAAPRC